MPAVPANGPLQVFTNASAISTATNYLDNSMPKQSHSLSVVAGAGVSAGVVGLAVSADGLNWGVPASASVTTAAPGTFVVGWQGAARYVTAQITTTVVGGTISAWVESSALG